MLTDAQIIDMWANRPFDVAEHSNIVAFARALLSASKPAAPLDPRQHGLPPYPKGHVVGPCVCGSWPGGECLKFPVIPAAPAQSAKPSCPHCGLTDIELSRTCHNSACAAYSREESFYTGWKDAAPQPTQPAKAGEAQHEDAASVDQIPCGWIRGVESYVPGEPTEWNVEFSWGDDEPEDGHKWVPVVFCSTAAPEHAGEAKRFPTPVSISTDKICEIAGKYNLGNPRLDALRCFVNEIIIVNEAEYAKSE